MRAHPGWLAVGLACLVGFGLGRAWTPPDAPPDEAEIVTELVQDGPSTSAHTGPGTLLWRSTEGVPVSVEAGDGTDVVFAGDELELWWTQGHPESRGWWRATHPEGAPPEAPRQLDPHQRLDVSPGSVVHVLITEDPDLDPAPLWSAPEASWTMRGVDWSRTRWSRARVVQAQPDTVSQPQ